MENILDAPLLSRKLGSGSFLQDLLAALTNQAKRFSLFSAHDDTLRALLFALYSNETDTSNWPPYASHIALELWTNTTSGQPLVVMQYNGAVLQMGSPCTSTFCPLQDFTALVNSLAITPKDCE